MLKCHLLDPTFVKWRILDQFEDRTIFQTREWINYIAETQGGRPLVAELREGVEVAGYFTGFIFKKFGVKILGSPFPGWTTPYMGFNLLPEVERGEALAAVEELAFGALKCLHLEISDRCFKVEDGQKMGFICRSYNSYLTDLSRTEKEIFQGMESACRRCIRHAEKNGVVIEEAHDPEFAEEYYSQLIDVFAKNDQLPTYGVERVRALIRNLKPTGRLLLLRARDPQGNSIGTGIYLGMNKVAHFWGNASFRYGLILRPNEALHWSALRYWKKQGIELYDWGGGGKYKKKYGCTPFAVPLFTKSRFRLLEVLRDEAQAFFKGKHRLRGWLRTSLRRYKDQI